MSKKPSKNKGMTSSFKASNIQTYAEGGPLDGAPIPRPLPKLPNSKPLIIPDLAEYNYRKQKYLDSLSSTQNGVFKEIGVTIDFLEGSKKSCAFALPKKSGASKFKKNAPDNYFYSPLGRNSTPQNTIKNLLGVLASTKDATKNNIYPTHIASSVNPNGTETFYAKYKTPVQYPVYKPVAKLEKSKIIEKLDSTNKDIFIPKKELDTTQQVIENPTIKDSYPIIEESINPPGPPPPPPFNGVEPFIEGNPIPEYATLDPGAEFVPDTERYIDWNGNSIGFNGVRFRKPGHGGDLIKKGGRHYLHYPSIETRHSADIVPEDTEEFAEGGEMDAASGGPGKPFAAKRAIENSSFYLSPFYTNSRGSAVVPSYMAGFGTGMADPRKGGWALTGRIGQEYEGAKPLTFARYNTVGAFNADKDPLVGEQLTPEQIAWYEANGGTPGSPYDLPEWQQKLTPQEDDKNISFGFDAAYRGPKMGERFTPLVNLGFNRSKSGGIGAYVTGGGQFSFGKNAGRNGELKPGYLAGSVGPYGGFDVGTSESGFNYGIEGSADWKPKAFRDTPLSVFGKGHLGGATSTGVTYGAELGLRAPMKQIKQIDLPQLPSMASLVNLTRGNNEEDNNLEQEPYIPDGGVGWGEAGKVNASPIHKRWQPEAEDIYIPSGPAASGSTITYDPSMGQTENTEEMNNYSKGGGIHINPANKGKFTASANAADMGVQEFASHVLANKGSYTPLQVQRANFAHNAAGWQHAQGGFNNRGFQALPPAVQAKIKSNSFADGGQLTEFNAGGTHEESPIGGIPQGMAPDGKMNLVEEGETKLNATDYVFSDQIKIDKETATLFGLPKGDIGKTFADASKKANRPNSRRDNDTIEQVAIQRDLENLMQAQEKQKEMQKDKDVAEFAAKYPDLAQNMPVPGQEQQMAPEQQMGQPPMMDPNAMQQGMMQEQMNPPAGVPQQMDPAMMAQMQQMGQMPMSYGGSIFNCGGKMYNDGGHMYGIGGNVMRGIGAGAYGIGEGLLNTLTFGTLDPFTDKLGEKLISAGNRSESEIEKDRMIRGFGNAAGAIGGAALTGGAATSAALSEGIEGVTAGVTNIKGTDEKFDKIAGGIGQGASMVAGLMGPQGATQAAGVFKGNEAVNKLMNIKQNPFINQATNFASSAMNSFAQGGRIPYSMYQPLDHVTQYGGNLNMPTNDHPYLNYLAMGGPEGETPANPTNPTLAFNLNGIVANYTLEQALADPLVLKAFGAESDEDGNLLKAPNLEEVKKAIAARFQEEAIDNRTKVGIAQSEYDAALSAAANAEAQLPGETKEQYDKRMSDLEAMNPKLDPKATISEIKQTPLQGALMALPAAYNIGRGLFEKAAVLDYNDYAQKANIDPYTMNIDPQVAEVRNAYAGAAQAIKNAAPGGGAYLSNMANVAAGKQEAMNELYTKKEMFDKEAKYKTDMANREVNASNLALKMQLQAYNDAARAAKMKSLQEGLGQLADIATNDQGIDVQTQYLKAISPDYAENFKYSSIFDQLQAAAKAKKASKKSGK